MASVPAKIDLRLQVTDEAASIADLKTIDKRVAHVFVGHPSEPARATALQLRGKQSAAGRKRFGVTIAFDQVVGPRAALAAYVQGIIPHVQTVSNCH